VFGYFRYQKVCASRASFRIAIRSSQRSENFLIKNSLLRVLRASAVQCPSPASQESLKTHMLQPPRIMRLTRRVNLL